MTDNIDELIQDIATKHGVVVGRDDPILILQTINEKLMQDSFSAQQELLENFKSEIESVSLRWGNDTQEKAEKILTTALSVSKNIIRESSEEGVKITIKKIENEIQSAERRIISKIKELRQVAILNIISAFLTILAAAIILIFRFY